MVLFLQISNFKFKMTIKKPSVRRYLKMFNMKRIVFLIWMSVLAVACSHNPLKIDVSGVKIDLKIKHLDVDLLKQKRENLPNAIPALKKSYGEFFDIFTYQMISIGGADQPNFAEMIYKFTSDTLITKLEKVVAEKIDTLRFRNELDLAFKHYHYYFPQKQIPAIYTCISGFNQSVVTSTNLIGVSLDKYMGAKSPFYEQLGLPLYKRRNMTPGRMVPEMMYAWAVTEWPMSDKSDNLLSEMIQEGKMMYFVDAMVPDLDDTLKIGYTRKQLDFCLKNEAPMWTYLAEHKLLFTTDRMSIKRFMDDGPYTAAFSEESPGRAGAWLGWQIVRSYMKNHTEVKLPELLGNQDFQGILNQSGYQP